MLFFSIMRIVEMKLVPKNKRGIFHKNSIKLEHYEENIIELFKGNRRIRRMIIITKDKKVLDLHKK